MKRTLLMIGAGAVLTFIMLTCMLSVIGDRNPQTPTPLVLHCADTEPHPRGSWPLDMDKDHHTVLNLRCSEIPAPPMQMMRDLMRR